MDQQKHVNLLMEGMNLDTHPSLQPPNSYRDAQNGTLISKDGNSYAYESIEGTTYNWSMPEHKTGEGKFVPIGWFRIGNRLIVHSTDDITTNGGPGEIGIVTFDNNGTGTYSAKYYHEDLKYTQAHMIFGYGLEENDNYHRSYWTDNFNQPRTINTASEILTKEYLTTQLVPGQQYMVLTDSIGSIEHPVASGNFYGPKQALGNVFTASTTTFTSFGSVKVIGYLDPIALDYTPAKTMGSIDFVKYLFGGSLLCGVKMYAYQLATADGYESSWSYTLNPIHVAPSNPAAGFQNYQGSDGSTNSGKAIELVISDIPSIFTKIKVAVIEVDAAYDVITNIEIFWISDVMGSTMTVTHYGQEHLLPLTLDDIELRKAVIARCKDITTIKQRQIIANLTEREELDWTPSGIAINELTYEIPADDKRLTVDNLQFSTNLCPSAGFSSGSILPGAHYVVRGGTGTVTYNAVVYNQGDTFVGVNGVKTFTVTLTAIVKGCIRIKNYDKFAGGQSYKIIDLNDEFWDYKSMASNCYLKGYWREETYRFAAVAWDLFGNPYAARWIGDKTIKSQSDGSGNYKLLKEYSSGSDYRYNLLAMGVTIDGLDISAIKDKISGISIVRVPRDKTVLAQALLLQCVDRNTGTVSCPVSTCQPANDNWAAAAGHTIAFTWNIIGPETDFGLSAFPIPLVNGDELKPVADYDPDSNGGQFARVGVDQDTYSKYYIHHNFTLPGGANGVGGYSPKIGLVKTVVTGDTFAYSSGGFPWTFKNHDIATAGFCPDPAGGSGGGTDLVSKAAVGGLRNLVLTDTADFINQDNGGAGTGVNPADMSSARKVLVNYRRPKATASLYGGSSAAAKANNKYIFTGHYLRIDAAVLADIDDGSGGFVLNGIEVFGGDCFVNLYDRVSSMYNSDYISTLLSNGSYSWGLIFPCESNINVGLRQQQHMCRDGLYNNTNGILFKDAATSRGLQDEKYFYNPAYSTDNDKIQYDALPLGLRDTGRFPYMARYSEQKVLGENIDNMRIFLLDNFKNADAIYGEINNIAVGIDRLFYWQNRGIGYFPVEERETTVGALGQAVQLGVGGVMQRADEMDNFYGNQHQSSLIRGENFFEWFDMRRKSVVRMTFNGSVVDASVVKGVQTFFENVFLIAEPDAFNILNLDTPLLGQGIIGVYDPMKKTAYHTFKFSSIEEYAAADLQRNRDFTIGISSTLGKFVGFFSFAPVIYIEHDSRIYAAKKTRQAIDGLIQYTVGMEVVKSGVNYVCILDFVTSDPVTANQQPDFGGSIYWKKTGEEDEIHRMFNGDICKFFGIVYPWYITMVVNPSIDESKTGDAAEVQGNNVPFSDVYCSNETLSSSDLSITRTNRNYRYYDGKWNFNFPLAGKQRLTDQHMLVKLQVKNYLTDITVSLNLQKRIVYLKTLFRLRK